MTTMMRMMNMMPMMHMPMRMRMLCYSPVTDASRYLRHCIALNREIATIFRFCFFSRGESRMKQLVLANDLRERM